MSRSYAIINVTTDAFLDWITKTNNIIAFINTEAVSANSSGAVTNGTGFVNGIFGANSIVATTITGGNSSVLGTLAVEANTIEAFEYVIVGANVIVNTTTLFVGNSTVNARVTSSTVTVANVNSNKLIANTDLTVGNSTVNTFINSSSITVNVANFTTAVIENITIGDGFTVNTGTFQSRMNVGSNLHINTGTIFIGNSSVNLVINSSGISGSFSIGGDILSANVMNAASLSLVGANVHANTSAFKVGNSTVNVVINSISIAGGANASLNVVNAATVNATTLIGVGANTQINTTALAVGNSTVNVVITGTGIAGVGNAALNIVNAATVNATTIVSVGANVSMNATTYFVGNSVANVRINSSGILGGGNAVFNVVSMQSLSIAVFDPSSIAIGANVVLNSSMLFIGNSSQNATMNSSLLKVNNINAETMNASSLIAVGANVRANTTSLFVGNSVSNVVITSSAIDGGPNATMNIANAVTVNATTLVGVGANVGANTTALFVGNATLNVVITSSAMTGTINVTANNFNGLNFIATDDFRAANSILDPSGLYLGWGETTNLVINTNTLHIMNSTSNTRISIPTTVQRAGSYFLHANGSWTEVSPSVPDPLSVATVNAATIVKVGGTGTTNVQINTTSIAVVNSIVTRFLVASNGNVGIANGVPTERLSVAGNIYTSSELISASDAALKEEIEYLVNALPLVMELKGSKYYMKDDTTKSRRKRFGLIAQDVEKVIPELVSGKRGKKSLSYIGLIPILVEAVKELSLQVEELKNDRKSK